MTEELIVQARQNCCRLCLAPNSECVPIFATSAADKEPLVSKIFACVNIKVTEEDRLSSRVCHVCISYLNSWQSFKNRCVAAQIKQLNWLELAKNTVSSQFAKLRASRENNNNYNNGVNNDNFSRTAQTNGAMQMTKQRKMPIPFMIKKEPTESDDVTHKDGEDESMKIDIDPQQFLAGNVEFGEEDENEHLPQPSILTSLGLKHINSVNPFSFLSTELGHEVKPKADLDAVSIKSIESNLTADAQTPLQPLNTPACRICKLSFSTRANARRHERNIHGNNFDASALQLDIKTPPNSKQATGQLTPEMMGIYDYANPAKYRHLLTEQKILFLRRNEDFLKQYQSMSCNCCQKTYPTYKYFMAHMRKKYQNLSRNLCFKCLKQFQTKAHFVAHLKRKNCVNLYKVYVNDSTIPKSGPDSVAVDKMGTKELLTNKLYECKLCGNTFRLKMKFRTHVNEAHAEYQKKDLPLGACGFCGLEIEDPMNRRRHYNNMECIVILHCGTCSEQFENHQLFTEHVYRRHLPSGVTDENNKSLDSAGETKPDVTDASPLKYPQCCKICGQRYNNYYNVLRHMESKHPDQLPNTYHCIECENGFPRQSALREHMMEVHGKPLSKSKREQCYSCRMCPEVFDAVPKWIMHQTEQHSEYLCCICNYQTSNIEDFKNHLEIHPKIVNGRRISSGSEFGQAEQISQSNGNSFSSSTNECSNTIDLAGMDTSNIIDEDHDNQENYQRKRMKLDTGMKECKICHTMFNSNLGLSNHMRAHIAQEQAKQAQLAGIAPPKSSKVNTKATIRNGNVGLVGDSRFRRMRCRICQKRFSTKKSYRRHMLAVHQVKNVRFIRCSVCKAEFTHEKGLKVHMCKIHGTTLSNAKVVEYFECDVCFIVYRDREQLMAHKKSVHGSVADRNQPQMKPPPSGETTYWFQCRYCPANFDTNKKLAIHINSHDEFDSNDYSCKDCGNVYSGRKSLWVHRYKKHPLIADPTECKKCEKIFFDKKMLLLHLKTHNSSEVFDQLQQLKAIVNDDSIVAPSGYRQLFDNTQCDQTKEVNDVKPNVSQKRISEVACTICNAKFRDQELFDKHMHMHEMELYTDNPLAAMFSVGPEDPDQFYMNRMDENGEYMCDICPRSFPVLTALKVHRNWHFRGDSKQLPTDLNSTSSNGGNRKRKRSHITPYRCQYCNSTYSNSSNLRRHILEIHRSEVGGSNENKNQPVFIEKYLECTKCNKTFQSHMEWVEHKILDTRASKQEATSDWNCEICGKKVTRKDRLVQHMAVHFKSEDINGSIISGDQGNSETGFESNSRDSISSNNAANQTSSNRTSIESPIKDDLVKTVMRRIQNNVKREMLDDENAVDGTVSKTNGSDNEIDINKIKADPDKNTSENDDVNLDEPGEDCRDDSDVGDGSDGGNGSDGDGDGGNGSDVGGNNDVGEDDGDGAENEDNINDDSAEIEEYEGEEDDENDPIEDDDDDDDEMGIDDENDHEEINFADDSTQNSDNDGDEVKVTENLGQYSCDLCQVFFDTAKQLRRHVTSHFLNGPGSVILTEMPKDKVNMTL